MRTDLPSSPAALRNRDPIADVLQDELPEKGLVLEVASGTGEHADYFAGRFPKLTWQPSDADPAALEWIRLRCRASDHFNLLDPLWLDATDEVWPVDHSDAMLCTNMVHISPWTATQGLLRGAGRLLPSGGPLILYGPYRRAGVETAPSNEAFDQSLRARNPDWGLRNVETVTTEAAVHGLAFERLIAMPANNLTLVFRRS